MSWYKPQLNLTTEQTAYIDTISEIFNVKNPLGQPIPYNMTNYQKEFHSESLNILHERAKDILFNKARGISFSTSSMIELIMTGLSFDEQTIPIIAHREKNAYKLLDLGKWLVQNSNMPEMIDKVEIKGSCIKFLDTGSTIEPFPSSSAADSVRTLRLIRALADEFAFQQNDSALYTAIQDCIQGDFGQILFGSTPCGRNNKYFQMVELAKSGQTDKFKLFNLPVFDPTKFNPKRTIFEQPWLIPIAPWISLKKLEEKRKFDWRIFMQENMTDFLDDGQSLISYTTIMNRINEDLHNYKDYLWSGKTFDTQNELVIGIDFSEYVDLFAISVFECIVTETSKIWVQRYLDYFNGIETPELLKYMREIFRLFPTFTLCRIDSTGSGSGLSNMLKREYGHRLQKVNFGSSITLLNKNDKENVRKFMINNIKIMMEENDMVQLINDDMQISHMGALDYSFKVVRDKEKGHGDIFFANALALMPLSFIRKVPMVSSVGMSRRTDAIDDKPVVQETLAQKLSRYKKVNINKLFQ